MRILLAEDEQQLARVVMTALAHEGYQVDWAKDGQQAVQLAQQTVYDLMILDIMMPVMNGIEALKEIRASGHTNHVIMLTAMAEVDDRVTGLDAGADDYLTKPFSMEELTFRIEAILRRVRGKKNRERTIYQLASYTFDTKKQVLSRNGESKKLTTKESELLGLLCAHTNEILQRDFALKKIWIDDNYFNARSMDVYITKLRKHLKDDPEVEIINIHGKGYKLICPEEDEA